jgi:hypothetical protein
VACEATMSSGVSFRVAPSWDTAYWITKQFEETESVMINVRRDVNSSVLHCI